MPSVFSYPIRHREQPMVDIAARTQYFTDYAARVTASCTTLETRQRQRAELQAIWASLPPMLE